LDSLPSARVSFKAQLLSLSYSAFRNPVRNCQSHLRLSQMTSYDSPWSAFPDQRPKEATEMSSISTHFQSSRLVRAILCAAACSAAFAIVLDLVRAESSSPVLVTIHKRLREEMANRTYAVRVVVYEGLNGLQAEDGDAGSAAGLQAAVPGGRISQRLNQSQDRLAAVPAAGFGQSGDGSPVGLFDLQHSTLDSPPVAARAASRRAGWGPSGVGRSVSGCR